MDRIEIAKKFYSQAQRMTLWMAAAVVAYGAIGFYLIHIGKGGPAGLNAQTYPIVKYSALAIAVLGVFGMQGVRARIIRSVQVGTPSSERSPQKLYVGTVLLSFGAEVALFLGMLLVFLGHQPYDYVPFAVVSLTGFTLAFPRKQQWSDWLGIEL